MNKEQFIYWLKGYAAGHEHAPTPKQWETIVSELDQIKDCPDYSSPIEEFKPSPMWQEPHYVNPWDKYKITCQPGDTNLTLLDDSLIIISSVALGFSLISLLESDILKLRDVAKKLEKI